MKKLTFLSLIFLTLCLWSCSKQKPTADIEFQIPTTVPSQSVSTTQIQPAPTDDSEPLEYVLEDIKGTVLIIPSGSTQPIAAEEEETVEAGDEVLTKDDSEASLTLDENTLFHLSPNSDVKVDQLIPNFSHGFISHLKLSEGKILSEVEKLSESKSTFEVESGGVVCGVRGTAFEVQKEGSNVNTDTFHGIVEMKKDNQVQQVMADQHASYSPEKGGFLPNRRLNSLEHNHYEGWLKQKVSVQEKQSRRTALLKSMASMPPEERNQMRQRLAQVKPKDRLKAMHQMMEQRQHPDIKHPQPPVHQQKLNKRNRQQETRVGKKGRTSGKKKTLEPKNKKTAGSQKRIHSQRKNGSGVKKAHPQKIKKEAPHQAKTNNSQVNHAPVHQAAKSKSQTKTAVKPKPSSKNQKDKKKKQEQ